MSTTREATHRLTDGTEIHLVAASNGVATFWHVTGPYAGQADEAPTTDVWPL